MKKLFLFAILSTSMVQASEIQTEWKKVNSLRLVSLAKAALFFGAGCVTGVHAVNFGFAAFEKNFFKRASVSAGLGYATWYFITEHFWRNFKHAFAIKD